MTRVCGKKLKRLRRHAKPGDPYRKNEHYWPRKIKADDAKRASLNEGTPP